MKKLRLKDSTHIVRAGSLVVADLLFYGNTNEHSVPSYLVIIGFLLLALNIYFVSFVVLSLLRLYGLPIKHKKRLAKYITGAASIIIALQSVGQLSVKDVLVLLPLTILGYVYVNYTKNRQTAN